MRAQQVASNDQRLAYPPRQTFSFRPVGDA